MKKYIVRIMRTFIPIVFSVCLLIFFSCNIQSPSPSLNDIQLIGSHNSYKIPIEEPLWEYIYAVDSAEALSLQYGHIPIREQLELGLRNLELDVFYDPEGGHLGHPKGLDIVRQMGKEPLPYDIEGKLDEPGFKLFHIQDIDFRSFHLLFKDCLNELKNWSDANPDHSPVFILMNAKDQKVPQTIDPLPFSSLAFKQLDEEILSSLGSEKLITPDWVRGGFKTLEEAILKRAWPSLENSKGRFLFILDEGKRKTDIYLKGNPSLEERVFFVNVPEGNPASAIHVVNDPIQSFDHIKKLVGKGYIVRTRADAGTREARTNDYSRFKKAIESGAQIISTDYYIPGKLFETSFKVVFDDGSYERIKD